MEWKDTPLCKLAQKWHTDKSHFHNYTPSYHRLLEGKTVKKVLEIGLGWAGLMHSEYPNAGSLLMWRDYFPEAEIYGLDIREDVLRNEERIHSFLCDQSSEESLRKAKELVGGNFDLIVDDGSHVPEHQVLTAKIFVPLLAPDGLYIIEDVHNDFFHPGAGEHVHYSEGEIRELDYVCANLPFPYEVLHLVNDLLPEDQFILIREATCRVAS